VNPAHECLYDVSWQKLRMRVMNKWATEEEARESISLLLAYIGRSKGRYWKFIRVWRCMNLTPWAARVTERAENEKGLRLLKVFNRGLQLEYDRYKHALVAPPLYKPWNWTKVGLDLRKLYDDDLPMFMRLKDHSEARRGKSKGEQAELSRFVRMMRDVVFDNA
jgi:hypothetical protein